MTPASIPAVKESLAARTSAELHALVRQATNAARLGDVRHLLDEAVGYSDA